MGFTEMIYSLFLLLFISDGLNSAIRIKGGLEVKIVGGKDANIKDYAYQVALQNVDELFCGGSLITPKHVLTATHCLRENDGLLDIYIRAGSSYVNEGGIVKKVVQRIEHPLYDSLTFDYDVAILVLESELPLSDSIQIIELSDENITDGNLAAATGWGLLKENGAFPFQLQKVNLPTISTETCRDIYGSVISDRMFCAGYKEGGRDTCQGDSGGPLALNGILIGITSWGDGCARMQSPGIYTKVAAVKSFIQQAVHDNP